MSKIPFQIITFQMPEYKSLLAREVKLYKLFGITIFRTSTEK